MSKPPVFIDLDYEAALEAARAKGRLRRQVIDQFERTARQVHRCLVAAGRLGDAAKVASTVRELAPTFSL